MPMPSKPYIVLFSVVLPILLGFFFVYPVHIPLSYFESDFLDYCIGIEEWDHIQLRTPYRRSALSSVLPYLLSIPFGVINGIAISSIISTIGIFLLMQYWVWEHSKEKSSFGVVATIFLTMGPILSLFRMVNFYPEICFTLLLGAYASYKLLNSPSYISTICGAIATVLVFCIDVRGMIWGIPYLLWAVASLAWRKHGKYLAVYMTLIILGWYTGSFSYNKFHASLSQQMDLRPLFRTLDPTNPLYQPPYTHPHGFIWGRSSFSDLWEELQFLYTQNQLPVPDAFHHFSTVSNSVEWFWLLCCVFTLTSMAWWIYKEKRIYWQIILPLSPFLYVFWKLPSVVEPHIRFYAQVLPAVVILLSMQITPYIAKLSIRQRWFCSIIVILFSILCTPQWKVARVMLQAHVEMSIPKAKEIYQHNGIDVGSEVHLYAYPLTTEQKFLESTWFGYCNTRLTTDGVIAPFYQILQPISTENP